jgi:hypothetical protein
LIGQHFSVPPGSLTARFAKTENGVGEYERFDFGWITSPSNPALNTGYCQARTGLLLAAEFEMLRNATEILKDFGKLLEITCPVKVMVYRVPTPTVRTRNRLDITKQKFLEMKKNLERAFDARGSFDRNEVWLLVGIRIFRPGEKWDVRGSSHRQVHIVVPGPAGQAIVEEPEWMSEFA